MSLFKTEHGSNNDRFAKHKISKNIQNCSGISDNLTFLMLCLHSMPTPRGFPFIKEQFTAKKPGLFSWRRIVPRKKNAMVETIEDKIYFHIKNMFRFCLCGHFTDNVEIL